MLRRPGSTIAEVVVSLTLAAIVLATATGSLLRQQRTTSALRYDGDVRGQLRMAVALLPAQLALAAPDAGDLVAGQLRDTAIQLRIPVASGITCTDGVEPTIPLDADSVGTTGIASAPRRGDSLWWYSADSARWVVRELGDAAARAGSCGTVTPSSGGAGQVMHLPIEGGDTVRAFAPLRITRQVRLVVYRSGDGTWQLGYREWSDATHSMGAPQPVAGPFLRVAPDGARTGFRFYDAAGAEVHPDVDAAAIARIARIRFTAVTPAGSPAPGTAARAARDSADVVIRPAPSG